MQGGPESSTLLSELFESFYSTEELFNIVWIICQKLLLYKVHSSLTSRETSSIFVYHIPIKTGFKSWFKSHKSHSFSQTSRASPARPCPSVGGQFINRQECARCWFWELRDGRKKKCIDFPANCLASHPTNQRTTNHFPISAKFMHNHKSASSALISSLARRESGMLIYLPAHKNTPNMGAKPAEGRQTGNVLKILEHYFSSLVLSKWQCWAGVSVLWLFLCF